uniref:Uncharacterized protein n=3 Tax=Oryza TaxID=4527 RepID=Q10MB1_ORYSJ|nr:hypothetical protein LOC_Os03g20110 [Oryza sativa Japonica Group]
MTERSIDVRGRSEIWMGSRKFFLDLYRNAGREVNSDILFVVPDHDCDFVYCRACKEKSISGLAEAEGTTA